MVSVKRIYMTKTATQTETSKVFTGVVTSDAMDKTIVVQVKRFVKHPKYHKFYKVSKKYKAHDENNTFKVGDTVSIKACRPISKDKSFTVVAE
jgi:small subunit ribosomal protein S17